MPKDQLSTASNNETDQVRVSTTSSIRSPPSPPPVASYIQEPLREHRSSMIILHGRGDNGPSFGKILLDELNSPVSSTVESSSDLSLAQAFPHTRFVFPTASPRASARFKGWKLNQWFDSWSLFDVALQPEVQDDGLRENSRAIEELIEKEAAKVGSEKVVVGGISNGAAMALVTVLLLIGEGKVSAERKLGGVFGLCGWLPYAVEMEKRLRNRMEGRDCDSVEGDWRPVIQWLCNHLGSPSIAEVPVPRSQNEGAEIREPRNELVLPVFLAHGKEDNKVPLERLEEASSALAALGFDIRSKVYEGLDHWYSDDMLADLVDWMSQGSFKRGYHSKP